MVDSFGPYRLEELLGRGGMGEVWRAYDTEQQREVALKMLPPTLSGDTEYVARFQREAQVAARLTDPHIVPIHRFGEHDGRLFIDMRLVEGRNLAEVLAVTGALAPARAVTVVEQLAAALDDAHDAGLVHRDVKPANAIVTNGIPEFVYLADFGIAHVVDAATGSRLTMTGDTIGSLEYMAPERFDARPVDRLVDVYSLGCVLYECLTGVKPYPYGEFGALINAHLNQPAPQPRSTHPALVAFDRVIARALAKDPADRYATCGELAAAARAALTETPATAATVVRGPAALPGAGSGHPGRRWLWTIAAIAVAIITIAVGTTVAMRLADDDDSVAMLTGPEGEVTTITTAQLDGRQVIISGSADNSVHIWDLTSGRPVGGPLTGDEGVEAVTAAQLDGRTVIIAGCRDTIRLWDLATGRGVGHPLTGQRGTDLDALTTAQLDGRTVIVGARWDYLKTWDLADGQPVGTPQKGHTDYATAITTAEREGRAVAITSSNDKTIRIWDLATGDPVDQPLTGHTDTVYSVTTAQLDGRTVIVSAATDKTIRFWDLATGQPVGTPITGSATLSWTLTTAQRDGRTVIISGGFDNKIHVWDLATGQPVGTPLSGHTEGITAVTTAQHDGRTVIISGSKDKTVRVWNMP